MASNLPPRPSLPRLPSLSPGSSVGQFNTQRQGALLQGQKQPNPAMDVGSVQTRVTRPVTNLDLADNKVSSALEMRSQTLKNFVKHTDQRTKKNQTLTWVKRTRMQQQRHSGGSSQSGVNTGIGHGGRGMVPVGRGQYLRADTASAFARMNADFRRAGLGVLGVASGYRSIAEQTRLYNLYRAGKGNVAAKPGHSNHNHGTAVDLTGYGGSTNSPQFRWLLRNAGRYGFSWAEGRSVGEPWHWVYVGG